MPSNIHASIISGDWAHPALIAPNNFLYKSLSNWSLNFAVGCSHACRFCYVPSASTNKLQPALLTHGVTDPDAQWGDYVFLRTWHEKKFLASLRAAERTPATDLTPDGNRAVMLCSTTDPYQIVRHPDPAEQKRLTEHGRFLVRRSLELIRDHSSINVRILTRSPLAREDFDLFKSFGPRLLFGMSLPTLRNDLSKIYEPRAPAPTARLTTLFLAKAAGIPTFVVLAPTYPESEDSDLQQTLAAVAELNPVTIFHEPINIRAENIQRIVTHAAAMGATLRTEVFADRSACKDYALDALFTVQRIARELGVGDRLHSWPDKSLGSDWVLNSLEDAHRQEYREWLQRCWNRVSEWPNCP
jgi:DNA repair photolyase